LFKSGRGLGPAASVAQCIGSELGEAILWKEAGVADTHSLSIFESPSPASFGGRQAFAGGRDLVFDTLRSVTSAASAIARSFDSRPRFGGPPDFPREAVVLFPVVVIEGRLFEAFEDHSGTMKIAEVGRSRVHWRGAPMISPHTTIDVVTSDALPGFAIERAAACKALIPQMVRAREEIRACFEKRSLEAMHIEQAARGVIGLPPLLHRLAAAIREDEEQKALPEATPSEENPED
jgi:hypothetical protein